MIEHICIIAALDCTKNAKELDRGTVSLVFMYISILCGLCNDQNAKRKKGEGKTVEDAESKIRQ